MKVLVMIAGMGLLAGCGVDGEPIRPALNTHVGVGSNGVNVGTNVSASTGNVSVGVGLGL